MVETFRRWPERDIRSLHDGGHDLYSNDRCHAVSSTAPIQEVLLYIYTLTPYIAEPNNLLIIYLVSSVGSHMHMKTT